MTVVIHNTDPGAPVLSAQVGALIPVLDYCLVTGLGWTKPYSGTNKAVYQMPPGTSGRFLRVDDTVNTTARFLGYESMSSIDVGTGPFPTAAMISGGQYVYKGVASTTARAWAFFGSGGFFHFCPSDGNYRQLVSFGDPLKRNPADAYATLCMGNTETTPWAVTATSSVFNRSLTPYPPHAICRGVSGLGGGVSFALSSAFNDFDGYASSWAGPLYLPDPVTGGMTLSRMRVMDGTPAFRAHVPGLWLAPHAPSNLQSTFASGDTLVGQAGTPLAGLTFEAIPVLSGSGYGYMFLETSDTWYS